MRIRAVQIESKYLKAGDLFAHTDPEDWHGFPVAALYLCLRDAVFVRESLVYRVTIEIEDKGAPTMDPHAAPGVT